MCDIDIQNDLKQFVLNTISIQVVEKICKFVHIQKTIFRVKIYMEKLLVHQLRTLKIIFVWNHDVMSICIINFTWICKSNNKKCTSEMKLS